MTVVSDSSPLIGLSTINSLELLHELFGAIDIPQAVYEEVVVKGAGRPGAQEIASATWITRRAVIDQQAVTKFKNKTALQQGESEAIVLALELSAALIILDDRSARQRAREVKLPVIGTLGVFFCLPKIDTCSLRSKDLWMHSGQQGGESVRCFMRLYCEPPGNYSRWRLKSLSRAAEDNSRPAIRPQAGAFPRPGQPTPKSHFSCRNGYT